jgi:hypothetical protein
MRPAPVCSEAGPQQVSQVCHQAPQFSSAVRYLLALLLLWTVTSTGSRASPGAAPPSTPDWSTFSTQLTVLSPVAFPQETRGPVSCTPTANSWMAWGPLSLLRTCQGLGGGGARLTASSPPSPLAAPSPGHSHLHPPSLFRASLLSAPPRAAALPSAPFFSLILAALALAGRAPQRAPGEGRRPCHALRS